MNNVSVMGRLTRDPELRYTQSGKACANFTLAVNKRLSKEKRDEFMTKGEATADFINVTAWGVLAETMTNYTEKGGRVLVNGRIEIQNYTDKEGSRRISSRVVASEINIIDFKGSGQTSKSGLDGFEDFAPVDGVDEDLPF